jgi:hypothetical protein
MRLPPDGREAIAAREQRDQSPAGCLTRSRAQHYAMWESTTRATLFVLIAGSFSNAGARDCEPR